jgi:inhibitor of cysteine peptidase
MFRQTWRKCFTLFVLVLLLALFVAQGKTLLLDDSDDNSHICLYVGDTLTIRLASNPTTGFSWGQPEVTHLQALSSDSEPGTSKRAGAPGFQTFSFKATEEGESTLTLNYFRPFEKATPPAKIFLLFVTIEPRPIVTKSSVGTP